VGLATLVAALFLGSAVPRLRLGAAAVFLVLILGAALALYRPPRGHFDVGRRTSDQARPGPPVAVAPFREVAFRAVEVEVIDDQAAAFYAKYGFLPFPGDPQHLALALETVEEVLGGERGG